MSIIHLARPEIQALVAYDAADQVDDTVRLNANESPNSSSPGKFRRPLNRYPEVRPQRLRDGLAARFGCEPRQLLVTRGSSEAIDLIIRAFCVAGRDNIVIPSPSFSMYRHYAEVQGAEVIDVASSAESDFSVDVEALLDARTAFTRILFICSPNNPTGTAIPRADLLAIIEGCADKTVVVVDEAYIEFSNDRSVSELLDQSPNLLILRTLSKALGFAGARCGAVIGNSAVIDLLAAIQAPYAIATPVVECVEDALQSDQLLIADNVVQEIISERERLSESISKYAFVSSVWPSSANFLLIRVNSPRQVIECCKAQGILLRSLDDELRGCIRITVGSREDNTRLLYALDALAENANG